MPRIWEALKRAERDRTRPGGGAPTASSPSPASGRSLRQKLIAVYQGIESRLPDKTSRVITFVGANSGDGTSTLVREFAMLANDELGKRVALFDVEQGRGGHYDYFGTAFETREGEGEDAGWTLEEALQPVGDDTLFLGCLSMHGSSASTVVARPEFREELEQLRERFQLVLFDAPPGMDSSDVLLLAPESDGVVLVVRAEKTRWQVAQSLRQRIEGQGGTILGVILNRRKFYIPRLIYKHL